MIYDSVKNIMKYAGINEHMKKACEFIAKTDLSALANGRYEIDGTNAYCVIQTPDLKDKAEIKWEAHKNYADIQLGIEDGEAAEYLPLEAVENWESYNPDWDCVYASDMPDGLSVKIAKGSFAVFFPWDAHRPCIKDTADKGHKAVIKVRID